TAYFCARRSPGRVLRVSTIFARVPATASTKRRVTVAVPDSNCRKLSAVRSAVSSTRARAMISHSSCPALTVSPSFTCQCTTAAGLSAAKAASNQAVPQITASSRVMTRPRASVSGAIRRAVRSPVPMSSASEAAMLRWISTRSCSESMAGPGKVGSGWSAANDWILSPRPSAPGAGYRRAGQARVALGLDQPTVEHPAGGVDGFARGESDRADALAGETVGRSAVQVHARDQGGFGGPALGEQADDEAGEHVAHAGAGHARVAGAVDEPAPVRCGHDAAATLEHYEGLVLSGDLERGVEAVGLQAGGV